MSLFAAKILIVEDDDKVSRMYEKILKHAGYHTYRAHTVEDAIDLIPRLDPDILCLDWQLEEGTSAPILEFLHGLDRTQLPQVMMISGNLSAENIAPYSDLVVGGLPKPVTLNDLVTSIKSLAEAARQRQPIRIYQVQELAPKVGLLRWAGRINEAFIAQNMAQAVVLRDAETVVFDLRHLAVEHFNLGHFSQPNHKPLPNLRYVHVVHQPHHQEYSQLIMSYLQGDFTVYYYINYEDALAYALASV